jgi:hypothetical protein
MGRKWNFILNSAVGQEGTVAGIDETFFIDWSRIPDKPYELTFTFACAGSTITITSLINIYVDLGQQSQLAVSSADSQVCGRVGYLGKLNYSSGGANQNLRAGTTDNLPLYLESRPSQNNVKVELFRNDGTGNFYTPLVVNYTLQLCLEEID